MQTFRKIKEFVQYRRYKNAFKINSNKKLSADIWVRNLFDEYYSTRGFFFGNEAPNFEETLYRRQGDPKNIGFSLRYNF